MRALRIIALLGLVSFSSGALPQYANFHDVDLFWSQNPQLFQQLFTTAKTQTVRIAILGDSQETSPTSEGFDYFPRLNYEMWRRYGNTPETPLEGCSNYGGGTPPADWLMRGVCTGASATRLAAFQYLPNMFPAAFTHSSPGQLTLLLDDAHDVDSAAQIPATQS